MRKLIAVPKWLGTILFILQLLAIIRLMAAEPKIDCKLGAGEAPIFLEKLQVKTSIIGPLAQTSLTMTFRNPHNRQLGGDLYFPMPEGATVSGYALDINGVLVDGVVVTKEKARVVFEKEMRKRVDPGIVEWTKGNNFKTRVFPIPPKGTRTVRVDYVTELEKDGDGLLYRLPLDFKNKLANFSLNVEVDSGNATPTVKQSPLEGVELAKWQQIYRASIEKKDVLLDKDLLVALPTAATQQVYLEEHNGEYFFIADVTTPATLLNLRAKVAPRKNIILVWDASASRAGGHKKELQLLREILANPNGQRITLYILRDTMMKDDEYTITDAAQVDKLINKLEGVEYDGGTSLGHLSLQKEAGECVLFFSDGISNWNGDTPNANTPVFAISAASTTDFSALKSICRKTGGKFFNLQTANNYQSIASKIIWPLPQLKITGIKSTGAATYGVYPKIGDPVGSDGRIRLVGRATKGEATITLKYGYSDEMAKDNTISLNTGNAIKGGLLRRYWAQRKLEELLLDQKKNEQAITDLGKQYSIVTPGTSLIVLENINQYVEHEITPPESLPDMLKQYNSITAQRAAQGKQMEESKLNRVLAMWRQQVQWWEKDYKPQNTNLVKKLAKRIFSGGVTNEQQAQLMEERDEEIALGTDAAPSTPTPASPPTVPAPPTTQEVAEFKAIEKINADTTVATSGLHPETIRQSVAASVSKSETKDDDDDDDDDESGDGWGAAPERTNPSASDMLSKQRIVQKAHSISVKGWDPKAPYLEALKEANESQRQKLYLALRKQYGSSPAFFLDCANYFYSTGDTVFANRVLSNIPEMELENAALLRAAAYRLLDAKQYGLAISLLREVKKMRPEEPQSWRDLALALYDFSQSNMDSSVEPASIKMRESLELLKHVVMNKWDRFDGIEVIALTEFNRILPRAEAMGIKREEIGIDPRLIKLLDMDIRVSMAWDADLTDIDLHVIEPSGEEVMYSHNLSAIGGKVSRDFTQGYGPETYDLRRAVSGKYKVRANYYGSDRVRLLGPVTLRLEIFTNYGRENETRQSVTMRLDKVKGMLDVAQIDKGKSNK